MFTSSATPSPRSGSPTTADAVSTGGRASVQRHALPGAPRRWWRALAVALMLHALVAGVLVTVVSIGILRGPQRPHYVVATLLPPPSPPAVTPAPTPPPVEPSSVPGPAVEPLVDSTLPLPARHTRRAPAAFAEGAAADAALSGGVPIPRPEPAPVTSPQAAPAVHADPARAVAHDTDAQRQWESRVLAHLEQHKRYPPRAQQWRQQDRVLLGIRVGRDGQVLSRRIVDSAGFALLDREAVDLMQRASPLPAPPDAVSDRELDFVVAIEFHLDSRTDALW